MSVAHHLTTDTDTDTAPQPPRPSATSRATVIATLVLLGLAVSLRASQTYGLLRDTMPSQLARDIDDPRLERLAIESAVLLGILVTVFAVAIFFVLARVLERHLFDARIGHGRFRIGLFGLTIVLCVLPYQVYALAVPPTVVGGSPAAAARTLAAAVLATLAFLPQLRAHGWVRASSAGGAAILLGLLTALG